MIESGEAFARLKVVREAPSGIVPLHRRSGPGHRCERRLQEQNLMALSGDQEIDERVNAFLTLSVRAGRCWD